VVSSDNRGRPIGEGTTAQLTASGDLMLRSADGKVVWSVGTAGQSIAGVSIGTDSNLVSVDMVACSRCSSCSDEVSRSLFSLRCSSRSGGVDRWLDGGSLVQALVQSIGSKLILEFGLRITAAAFLLFQDVLQTRFWRVILHDTAADSLIETLYLNS
jgi:hypothetical protein